MGKTTSTVFMHRLDQFDPTENFDREASTAKLMLWHLVNACFFLSPLKWPNRFKTTLLRWFGATIGSHLYIRPRVNIHFPWKLTVGDHVWIGDRCELLSMERITLGSHTALGHDVYLAAGSHDIRSGRMRYNNSPIVIGSGCWIATRAFVGPGVTIGDGTVVGACSVVMKDLPAGVLAAGNPVRVIKERVVDRDLNEAAAAG